MPRFGLRWELADRVLSPPQLYGLDVGDCFANGKEWLDAFLDDIPSAAINITRSDKGFRNFDKKSTGNDIRDADGVSPAILYCDFVMTDNYVAAQLANSTAVIRHGTLVLKPGGCSCAGIAAPACRVAGVAPRRTGRRGCSAVRAARLPVAAGH